MSTKPDVILKDVFILNNFKVYFVLCTFINLQNCTSKFRSCVHVCRVSVYLCSAVYLGDEVNTACIQKYLKL